MTSFRQVEANRQNSRKSTGPKTEAGKDSSRCNAIRHGLTAETVIGALENAEDYKVFESAVTSDFNPETAIERELVLRLASLLWRLRRAASIETGMFQASTENVAGGHQTVDPELETVTAAKAHVGALVSPVSVRPIIHEHANHQEALAHHSDPDFGRNPPVKDVDLVSHLAARFLHLAAVDKGAFERLGRYETALWRQACQTVFMLEVLRRQSVDMKWLPRSSHAGRNPFSLFVFPRR